MTWVGRGSFSLALGLSIAASACVYDVERPTTDDADGAGSSTGGASSNGGAASTGGSGGIAGAECAAEPLEFPPTCAMTDDFNYDCPRPGNCGGIWAKDNDVVIAGGVAIATATTSAAPNYSGLRRYNDIDGTLNDIVDCTVSVQVDASAVAQGSVSFTIEREGTPGPGSGDPNANAGLTYFGQDGGTHLYVHGPSGQMGGESSIPGIPTAFRVARSGGEIFASVKVVGDDCWHDLPQISFPDYGGTQYRVVKLAVYQEGSATFDRLFDPDL